MTLGRPAPRFVVGLPRAGTTWLCRSLNSHPDVMAFGETMFWGKAYVAPPAGGRHDASSLQRVRMGLQSKPLESTLAIAGPGGFRHVTREGLQAILDRAFSELGAAPTPADVFSQVACAIAAAEGKSQWVEKTPHHLLYAARILRHFPDALFVVMMREPYSFLRSYKNQRGHDGSAASRKRFERRYHPLGAALVWRNSWRAAQALLASASANAMLVRLEEIEHDPAGVMRRVHSFLDLRPGEDSSVISSRINSAFESSDGVALTDSEIAWMNLVAEKDIRAAGYTPVRTSVTNALLSRWMVALPIWVVRVLWDLRKTTSGSVVRHAWRWAMRASPEASASRSK